MSLRLQIFVAVVVIAALIYIVNMVRKRRLELKYALVWFFVGILMLLIDLIPGILEWMTGLLGIALPINMLFLLGFGFVLLILFTQTIVITNLSRRVKRLTQEVGMLNKRLDDEIEHTAREQQPGIILRYIGHGKRGAAFEVTGSSRPRRKQADAPGAGASDSTGTDSGTAPDAEQPSYHDIVHETPETSETSEENRHE